MKWLSDLIKKKSLIFVGAELTLLYFMIFGFIWFHYVDYPKNLTLNELGDLLAGMFAPLAFLWMVITILMQGKELRLQREELSMQRQELANSSAQLERQSNVMERQQNLELREAQFKELEDKLRDFTDMLVVAGLLSSKYKEHVYDGRVSTPGFFKHHYFRYVSDSFGDRIKSLESNGSKKEDFYKYTDEINQVVLLGNKLIDLSAEYDLDNFLMKIGFFQFFVAFREKVDTVKLKISARA